MPPRGEASTSRKTRWPASTGYSGLIWPPIVCATPSTIPPSERAPQRRAEAADHDGLEGEDQLRRSRIGVEARADREEHAADRGDRDGDRGGARVDGRELIPTSSAVSGSCAVARIWRPACVLERNSCRPPKIRTATPSVSAPIAEIDSWLVICQLAVAIEPAFCAERANIGREPLLEQVLNDDREPEGRQQRHQQSRAQAALEQRALQHVADQQHHRQHRQDREERRGVPVLEQEEDEVGTEHGEVAVREVDDPHDAEHQRQPAGEQPVEAAEQDALDDVVDPRSRVHPLGRAAARSRPR